MQLSLRSSLILSAAMLLLPSIARPGAISINGVCEQGNCSSVDSVGYGGSTGPITFNFLYTAGSDVYRIAGDYSASYDANGIAFNVFIGATYAGTAPSTSNDSLTVNVFQNFYDTSPYPWDGTYGSGFPLTVTGNVGTGSTISTQYLLDGQTTGLAGPYGPGSYSVNESANLTGLDGDYLDAQAQYVFDFNGGSQPGATMITLAAPEPNMGWLACCGLLATFVLSYSWRRLAMRTAARPRLTS